MGMGAASLVIESEDACRERGVRGICEVVSSVTANSAFHGTRLDVKHVGQVMDRLVSVAEARFGLNRSPLQPALLLYPMKHTPQPGVGVPVQRSMPCGIPSKKMQIRSSLPIPKALRDIRWELELRMW